MATDKSRPVPEMIGSLVVESGERRMLEVVEAGDFSRDAKEILTEEELTELRNELATFRQLGRVIKETGGARKFRYGAKEKGKRGGARIIYYYGGDHMPIYLLAIYGKSEKIDITGPEKKAMRKMIATINANHQIRKVAVTLRVLSGGGKKRR